MIALAQDDCPRVCVLSSQKELVPGCQFAGGIPSEGLRECVFRSRLSL